MKHNLIIPTLTLVVGIGIGVAVDRTVVTTGQNDGSGEQQSSVAAMGPRAAMERGVSARSLSGADNSSQLERNPVATVRRVSKQLEMSPMVGIDYENFYEAYEAIRWMKPDDILLALAGLGNQQGDAILRMMLMGHWAKQDGQGATEYSLAVESPMGKAMDVMSSVMGWMKHDPGNAYQWYKNNRHELSDGMMVGVNMDSMFVSSLALQDMDMAFKELRGLSRQSQSVALTTMANSVGNDDVKRQQYLMYLDKFDDDLKRGAMNGVLRTWATTDPHGAIGYLEKMDPKPENYDSLMDSAESSWSNVAPEAAIQWQLKNVGEGEVAGDKIADSFGNWAMNDPQGAEKWLSEQPEGFATDKLYSEAASNLTWMDPEGATKWAVRVQDEVTRENSLNTIYQCLKFQGGSAVKIWMDGLDPETRVKVEEIQASDANLTDES